MKVDVAVFAPSFGNGGAEKMTINLCRGLAEYGYTVDLIVKDKNIPFVDMAGRDFRIVEFSKDKKRIKRELVLYLKKYTPKVLISTKGGDRETIWAKKHLDFPTKIVLRHGTTFSVRDRARNFLKRTLSRYKLKNTLKNADLILAVSNGVAEDIRNITGISKDKIKVVPNPTIVPEMFELVRKEVDHPWFKHKDCPIILGAGGFRKSKDFPTLIEAFSMVKKEIPSKLVILGDGRGRDKLERLVKKLNLLNDVWLPGFQENPYAFMARADLFVLSSIWEGSPNVLIEAMALGVPVVSTDCPSGPREILQGGEYGALVAPKDITSLAREMVNTLKNPLPSQVLREAVKRYELKNSIKSHIHALGI